MVSVIKLLRLLLSEAHSHSKVEQTSRRHSSEWAGSFPTHMQTPLCPQHISPEAGPTRAVLPTQMPLCQRLSLSRDKAHTWEWERKKRKSMHTKAVSCLSQNLGPSVALVCLCVFLKFVSYTFFQCQFLLVYSPLMRKMSSKRADIPEDPKVCINPPLWWELPGSSTVSYAAVAYVLSLTHGACFSEY